MTKHLLVVMLSFAILSMHIRADEKKSFLVKPPVRTRLSKNRMKENIGEELKEALHACASIVDKLGCVQQEVASLQQRLLSRVEKLIENSRSFKKAKRDELSDALTIMSDVKEQLKTQERHVKTLAARMDKNVCLKG